LFAAKLADFGIKKSEADVEPVLSKGFHKISFILVLVLVLEFLPSITIMRTRRRTNGWESCSAGAAGRAAGI
jgi:hypothetical protein